MDFTTVGARGVAGVALVQILTTPQSHIHMRDNLQAYTHDTLASHNTHSLVPCGATVSPYMRV